MPFRRITNPYKPNCVRQIGRLVFTPPDVRPLLALAISTVRGESARAARTHKDI